jgi:DNA (cytosine-5)-methyltransferase 1
MSGQMRVLDLFSGIGGFSLGLERAGMQTVAFCEIDPFCQRVLAKHWPGVPIYDDVREVTATRLAADGIGIDVICGGFPCQDISSAGAKVGIGGERSGLWREYARIIGEVRPRYVVVENVAALLARGMSEVLGDMAALGYDAEWHCIPAAAIGAPHGRDRLWIVGHPDGYGEPGRPFNAKASGRPPDVADAKLGLGPLGLYLAGVGRAGKLDAFNAWNGEPQDQPDFLGVDDGLPSRLDRLRSLGNAVVPQIPEMIGRAILATEAA